MGRLATRLNRGFSRVFGYEVVPSRASAQDSMMLAHHAAVSEACRRPLSSDLQARIVMLGLLMAPRRVTSHRKIRVGGRTDGGYVMLDDFARLQTAFSLGVGPNVDWDYAIAERGIAVHQFDHTVSGPPKRHPGFHFNKRRIDAQASGDTDNLETLLERNGSTARFSNLLKLDIEGSEWALLAEADAGSLSRFPQILCEVHDLALVHDDKHFDLMMRALRRLREIFEVVHVHGNNCGGRLFVADQAMPNVLELTLANREVYAFTEDPETFPTELDCPNDPRVPDYYLGDFHFDKTTGLDIDTLTARAQRTQAVIGFDAARYIEANPDIVDAGHDPWTHWSLWGWREGRPLSLDEIGFDAQAYLAANPDVVAAGFDALTHWRHFGRPRFPKSRPEDADAASVSGTLLLDDAVEDLDEGAHLLHRQLPELQTDQRPTLDTALIADRHGEHHGPGLGPHVEHARPPQAARHRVGDAGHLDAATGDRHVADLHVEHSAPRG